MSPQVTFVCTKCGEEKLETEFYRYKHDHRCKACTRANTARWAKENPEKVKAYRKQHRKNTIRDLEREAAFKRARRAANPEKYREKDNAYYHANLERERARSNEWMKRAGARRKAVVFDHYGWLCKCCGEDQVAFLTIDHINNDGAQHRREIGSWASEFYKWLVKNDFPKGFQTLCMNCNWAKSRGGCPHGNC